MMIRKMSDVAVIDLEWEGPFTLEQVGHLKRDHDYGIYQIYGTHNVLGPDTLLYIGKAYEQFFADRITTGHKHWIDSEPGSTHIYLGHVCGTEPMTEANWPLWEGIVNDAEALLIYFCSPPYNSSGLQSLRQMPPTIVSNYKRRDRLPPLVSNIYEMAWNGPATPLPWANVSGGLQLWFGLERGAPLELLDGATPFSISTQYLQYWVNPTPPLTGKPSLSRVLLSRSSSPKLSSTT